MRADLAAWARQYEVIVLEGCDGVGKTTLATALTTGYGYRAIHADRTPEGIDVSARHHAILTQPGRLVLDRSFVSELVYGPLLHNRARLTPRQVVELAGLIAARRGVLIHLTAGPEQIQARLRVRDGQAPALDHLCDLIARYTTVFAALAAHAPVLTIEAA